MNPNAPVFVPVMAQPGSGHGPVLTDPSASSDRAGAVRQGSKNNQRNRKSTARTGLETDANGRVAGHLLGFKYASKPADTLPSSQHWRSRASRKPNIPFSKERFLQANCQFLIRGDDSGVHVADPDVAVDWDIVQLVRLFSHSKIVCPICLGEPQPARITKCGHCYCYPCLLHYLSLSDRLWRKCPICFNPVYADALRRAEIAYREEVQSGSELRMRLVQRAKGQATVLPASAWTAARANHLPLHTDAVAAAFCNIHILPDFDVLNKLIPADEAALLALLREAESSPDASEARYFQLALDALAEERGAILAMGESAPRVDADVPHRDIPQPEWPQRSGAPPTDHGLVVFYQATDGQRIFLHSVNVRALMAEYGDMTLCPRDIVGTVLQLDAFTMTEEARKRYKFLAHLPLGSDVMLAELNLAQYLSPATAAQFADEVGQRAARRKVKARQEHVKERRQTKAHRERVDTTDITQFPVYSLVSAQPDVYVPDPALLLPTALPALPSGPSFAQAARTQAAPKPAALAPAPASRVTPRMVPLGRSKTSDSDSDNEWAPPAFASSFSLALATPLRTGAGSNEAKGQGKKSKPKTVLFSTASHRRS